MCGLDLHFTIRAHTRLRARVEQAERARPRVRCCANPRIKEIADVFACGRAQVDGKELPKENAASVGRETGEGRGRVGGGCWEFLPKENEWFSLGRRRPHLRETTSHQK